MWPTGSAPRWRVAGLPGTVAGRPGTVPAGPAITTLRSVIAHLASRIRLAGAVYIVVQVVIWHSFYTAAPWRLAGPALAVAWSLGLTVYLRRNWPSALLACVDCAVYGALAVFAQACVPPAVRDDVFSWLVICQSGQLVVPAWYAPGALAVLVAVKAPAAYLTGALLQPVTDARTLAGAALLLLVIGTAHGYGRRVLFGRAAAADVSLRRADQAASDQYAALRTALERREHERLVHDTVLNTLTALTLAGGDDQAMTVNRCRQDVSLIERALNGAGQAPGSPHQPESPREAGSPPEPGDLPSALRTVAAAMRARGLTVHLDLADGEEPAVPERVVTAFSNATREALSNVAAHAGTGEAWVQVRAGLTGQARTPGRLEVLVRDTGAGFDLARVDRGRLGLRRSIAERAAECGGQASVWSVPGQGTEVSLCWPASPRPGALVPAGPDLATRGPAPEGQPW